MSSVTLILDGREIEAPEGQTILEAALEHGISVPTLCHLNGTGKFTSCMICVVHETQTGKLIPACSAPVQEGMRIETGNEAVQDARRHALSFLLSEHVGDCQAPCQRACPAHMDIPRMIRLIRDGRNSEALVTIKNDIALPAVLGRICSAPCEKACKRRFHDDPVSICLLKRYTADVDLERDLPFRLEPQKRTGGSVAIVGAGPTGLAAAFHLARAGYDCVVFDRNPEPGGMLRYGVPEEKLPRSVLDAEIERIASLGVEFRQDQTLGETLDLQDLRDTHGAVILAVGALEDGDLPVPQLERTPRGLKVDKATFETSVPGVFAGGSAVAPSQMAIRAVAQGKDMAHSALQYLEHRPLTGIPRRFNSVMGKPLAGEMEEFFKEAESHGRLSPEGGSGSGFREREARDEAARCLGCDCRKPDTCKLREYADVYHASPLPFPGEERTGFLRNVQHDLVIYEPGKCIRCGLCVRLAKKYGEELGLTFVGRGFDVRVETPFRESLRRGLARAAAECVAACPTAALAWKDREGSNHV
ncbi:MAG: FAD-dependent oxidoreductase [Candidatus Aminicenantaceae bacterium]